LNRLAIKQGFINVLRLRYCDTKKMKMVNLSLNLVDKCVILLEARPLF